MCELSFELAASGFGMMMNWVNCCFQKKNSIIGNYGHQPTNIGHQVKKVLPVDGFVQFLNHANVGRDAHWQTKNEHNS